MDGKKIKAKGVMLGVLAAFSLLAQILAAANLLFQAGLTFESSYTAVVLVMLLSALVFAFCRLPILAAPNIATFAWLVYGEVISKGEPVENVLGAGLIASIISLAIISVTGRQILEQIFPESLRLGLMAGLGVMLIMEGLYEGSIIAASPVNVIMLGNFSDPVAYFSLLGILLTVALLVNKIPGALFLGAACIFLLSLIEGFVAIPDAPFLLPAFDSLLVLNPLGGFNRPDIIFSLVMVLIFSSIGTGTALLEDRMAVVKSAKITYGSGTITALLGALPLEIAPQAAILPREKESARLAVSSAAVLLALFLFAAPLGKSLTDFPAIISPALVAVGLMLLLRLKGAETLDNAEKIAALTLVFLMAVAKDMTLSIGASLITLVFLRLVSGHWREVKIGQIIVAAVFFVYFLLS